MVNKCKWIKIVKWGKQDSNSDKQLHISIDRCRLKKRLGELPFHLSSTGSWIII